MSDTILIKKEDLQRIHAEGRGEIKVEILNLMHELRMLPKEQVTITFIESKIREL